MNLASWQKVSSAIICSKNGNKSRVLNTYTRCEERDEYEYQQRNVDQVTIDLTNGI